MKAKCLPGGIQGAVDTVRSWHINSPRLHKLHNKLHNKDISLPLGMLKLIKSECFHCDIRSRTAWCTLLLKLKVVFILYSHHLFFFLLIIVTFADSKYKEQSTKLEFNHVMKRKLGTDLDSKSIKMFYDSAPAVISLTDWFYSNDIFIISFLTRHSYDPL